MLPSKRSLPFIAEEPPFKRQPLSLDFELAVSFPEPCVAIDKIFDGSTLIKDRLERFLIANRIVGFECCHIMGIDLYRIRYTSGASAYKQFYNTYVQPCLDNYLSQLNPPPAEEVQIVAESPPEAVKNPVLRVTTKLTKFRRTLKLQICPPDFSFKEVQLEKFVFPSQIKFGSETNKPNLLILNATRLKLIKIIILYMETRLLSVKVNMADLFSKVPNSYPKMVRNLSWCRDTKIKRLTSTFQLVKMIESLWSELMNSMVNAVEITSQPPKTPASVSTQSIFRPVAPRLTFTQWIKDNPEVCPFVNSDSYWTPS